MAKWLRGLLILGVLAAAATLAARRRSAPRTALTGAEPRDAQWPPFDPSPSAPAEAD